MEVRKIEVDLAQRDFQNAKAREMVEQDRLNMMVASLEENLARRFSTQKSGGQVSENLKTIQTFIEGQKVRIQNQEKVIEGLAKITEDKRLVLVEMMKNLKTLEKLKEKRFNEFKKEVRKREVKVLDELVVMEHGRRGNQ